MWLWCERVITHVLGTFITHLLVHMHQKKIARRNRSKNCKTSVNWSLVNSTVSAFVCLKQTLTYLIPHLLCGPGPWTTHMDQVWLQVRTTLTGLPKFWWPDNGPSTINPGSGRLAEICRNHTIIQSATLFHSFRYLFHNDNQFSFRWCTVNTRSVKMLKKFSEGSRKKYRNVRGGGEGRCSTLD